MEKKHIIYLDLLRISATIAVIMIHATGFHWMSLTVYSADWDIYNFYRCLVRWAVPIFVMISGALFLGKELNTKKLYTQNLVRIVTSFVFWSFVYAVYGYKGSIKQFIYDFLHGAGHMWFLFLIAAIYLVLPAFKKLVFYMNGWFLPVSICIGFLIPAVFEAGPEFLGISVIDQHIIFIMKIFQKVFGWLGYFYLGYYVSQKDTAGRIRFLWYGLGTFAMVLSYYAFKAYAYRKGSAVNEFYDNISITVLLESIAVFILMKNINWKFSPGREKAVIKISKYTFGVYMVHMLIFYMIENRHPIVGQNKSSLFILPLVTIIVFFVSLLISLCLNYLPILKRYIV